MSNYEFSDQQLSKLLDAAIGLYEEFREVYGYSDERAMPLAIAGIFEGLNAERDLIAVGQLARPTLQVWPRAEPKCDWPDCNRPALHDDIFCQRHRAEENLRK